MSSGYPNNNVIPPETPDFLCKMTIFKKTVSTDILPKFVKNDFFGGFYGRKVLKIII